MMKGALFLTLHSALCTSAFTVNFGAGRVVLCIGRAAGHSEVNNFKTEASGRAVLGRWAVPPEGVKDEVSSFLRGRTHNRRRARGPLGH